MADFDGRLYHRAALQDPTKGKNREGRHIGLDVYDLLIEA
jgi:hypothetical protein